MRPNASRRRCGIVALSLAAAGLIVSPAAAAAEAGGGEAAVFGDWTRDAPGVVHHITPADLPRPFATRSASNTPTLIPPPNGAKPKVPPGFAVEEFARGLEGPRLLRVAPNGDVFVADMSAGQILVLRNNGPGKPATVAHFAEGLEEPFGLAFYPAGRDPRYLYVGTVGAVLRFPYRNGDVMARGRPETVVPQLPDAGGHQTRDLVFSRDGRSMFVSVGSASNDSDGSAETRRADILVFAPDGSGEHVYAAGLRNPVGLAVHPLTGDLWTAVNERDGLGDNLPPDYVTRVKASGFYGWPWYYIGDHQDPRHKGEKPALAGRITLPDVLIQPHSAPLQLAVYTGRQFPAAYRGDIFVALHGSWNRSQRTGYKVVRVRLHDGVPTGEYEDFLTGFVTEDGKVWGRPVGVAVAADGSLLVSEDANGTVWRISYVGRR